MRRKPEPYYKQSHKAWYVDRGGKPVRLAKGDKAATEEAAWAEYHKIMAGKLPVDDKTTVAEVVARFLTHVEATKAKGTHDWYVKFLAKSPAKANVRRSFLDYIGDRKRVSNLKPFDVQFWLDEEYKDQSDNYKNSAAQAVAACFNWAADIEIVERNPIKKFKRPAATPRDKYLTDEQWKRVIGAVDAADPFADLLWFLHETGARPQEARIIAAHHFKGETLTLERKNSKGKKVCRVIRLNRRAGAIVARLVAMYPDGPLFRNRRGVPWTVYAMGCRFAALRKKLGMKDLFPYILRHTFVTNALVRGCSVLDVAKLVGHKDGNMIQQVYGHLEQDQDYMDAKLRQATGEDTA